MTYLIFASYYALLCIIMHLLLFLSPDWLIFCHMIISLSYKFTRFFIYFPFLSAEGPTFETGQRSLDLSVSAAHCHQPFHISICISTLPRQHAHYIYCIMDV